MNRCKRNTCKCSTRTCRTGCGSRNNKCRKCNSCESTCGSIWPGSCENTCGSSGCSNSCNLCSLCNRCCGGGRTVYINNPVTAFSVTYLPNGGTGNYTDSNIPSGTEYTVKNNTDVGIERTGYTFTGWNTEADGGGTEYQPGSKINVTGNVTLYAQWTPTATFSVSYNANGGTGEHEDTGIVSGTEYTVKSDTDVGITKADSTFTGWNTEAGGGGTEYQAGSKINVTADVTLYAQWTPTVTFSVSYNANGGTGEHEDTGIARDTQYKVKSNTEVGITKPDSTFESWNTEAGGGGDSYQTGADLTITADVTLYAQWA